MVQDDLRSQTALSGGGRAAPGEARGAAGLCVPGDVSGVTARDTFAD
jgi:hypothetical protein